MENYSTTSLEAAAHVRFLTAEAPSAFPALKEATVVCLMKCTGYG